ncbi:hypothetical protein BD309DRAFT_737644 [Dichomitus squalens]|nr:hypothetical protein BD309DRAFT_737644 [Dichomitus squalens]
MLSCTLSCMQLYFLSSPNILSLLPTRRPMYLSVSVPHASSLRPRTSDIGREHRGTSEAKDADFHNLVRWPWPVTDSATRAYPSWLKAVQQLREPLLVSNFRA